MFEKTNFERVEVETIKVEGVAGSPNCRGNVAWMSLTLRDGDSIVIGDPSIALVTAYSNGKTIQMKICAARTTVVNREVNYFAKLGFQAARESSGHNNAMPEM